MKTKFDICEVVTVKAIVEKIEIMNDGRTIYKLKLLGNDEILNHYYQLQ